MSGRSCLGPAAFVFPFGVKSFSWVVPKRPRLNTPCPYQMWFRRGGRSGSVNTMGRRSSHTPEELRELILEASTELINEGGLASLSAREVARRIGYSPGTLYNVFENLDDLVLTIEGRLLDQLSAKLAQVKPSGSAHEHMLDMARVYLRFTHDHPRLWNLLFEHHLPANQNIPAWYQQKLDGLMAHVRAALAPVMPNADQDQIRRAASVLWAGVHGITSLSTADKLSTVTTDGANALVDDLVLTYMNGLSSKTGS